MATTETITDTDNQYSWASKTITTDDSGLTLSTVTVLDDGNRLTDTFDPYFSLQTITFEDLADTKNFALRSATYFVWPDTGERVPHPQSQVKVDDKGFREEWDNRGDLNT